MVTSLQQRQDLFPEPDPKLEASAAIIASLLRQEQMLAAMGEYLVAMDKSQRVTTALLIGCIDELQAHLAAFSK